MPFPESERVIFRQNPLAEVICQLRFPPILSIASSEPAAFQDKIRAKYPLYERDEARLPEDIESIARSLPIQLSSGVSHRFATADGGKTVSLTRDFLAYADQDYQRWEDFSTNLWEAVEALEDIYKPAFYSRLGLRYRDVIDRKRLNLQGKPWSELLQPWVLSLLAQDSIGDLVVATQSRATIKIPEAGDNAFVTLRYGFPQDNSEARDVYSVDADFFTKGRIERGRVVELLAIFNKRAGDLFRWCITEQLREALEPRPLGRVHSSPS